MRIKNHFPINSFAPSLILKQELGATQKWSNKPALLVTYAKLSDSGDIVKTRSRENTVGWI